ncbi:hypothetical protein M0657_001792 [Pyricularia oryzae]|nr:hypothetical protein M9X92_000895 [Pyricularia oryzae]KAI7930323.1 hypothetical protein M0657_001792 [Pyricularia oryzae]
MVPLWQKVDVSRVRAIEGVEETDPNNQAIGSLGVADVRSGLEHLPQLVDESYVRREAVQLTKESQGAVVVALGVVTFVARGILPVFRWSTRLGAGEDERTGPNLCRHAVKDANALIGTGLVQLAGGDLKHES